MDKNVLYILFGYGSRVYGTNTPSSDRDFICLSQSTDVYEDPRGTCQAYSLEDFKKKIIEHDVSILESISLILSHNTDQFRIMPWADEYLFEILTCYKENFNIPSLRKSFSQVSSNSFVKAKKKIVLENEDSYIGIKSLFHSIRILDFGTQIAKNKNHYIWDFRSCNDIWLEIYSKKDEIMKCVGNEEEYKKLTQPWKKLYNEKHSEFKKVTEKF